MMPAPSPIVLSARDKRAEVSGCVLTETFRAPGLLLPPHFHEHANIALTLEGSFMETVGTQPYEVNPLQRDFSSRRREAFQPVREDCGSLLDH